jgi:hypothetical protein
MTTGRNPYFALAATLLLAVAFISCSTSNPNTDRVLISVAVTPETADALNSPNGQVTFTATGTFNLPPITAPVTFTAPYAGSFAVNNPSNQIIANVVSSGTGTVTVECVNGVSGTVGVVASASANNGTSVMISASGQLTCP